MQDRRIATSTHACRKLAVVEVRGGGVVGERPGVVSAVELGARQDRAGQAVTGGGCVRLSQRRAADPAHTVARRPPTVASGRGRCRGGWRERGLRERAVEGPPRIVGDGSTLGGRRCCGFSRAVPDAAVHRAKMCGGRCELLCAQTVHELSPRREGESSTRIQPAGLWAAGKDVVGEDASSDGSGKLARQARLDQGRYCPRLGGSGTDPGRTRLLFLLFPLGPAQRFERKEREERREEAHCARRRRQSSRRPKQAAQR